MRKGTAAARLRVTDYALRLSVFRALVGFKRVYRQWAAQRRGLAVAKRELRLEHLVDLARPLVDHGRAGVAEMTLSGILTRVATRAEDLDRIIRRLQRRIAVHPP